MSDSRGRGVARQLHSGGQAGGQAQSLERDDDCLNRFWDSLDLDVKYEDILY